MRNKVLFIIIIVVVIPFLSLTQNPLDVKEYKLPNGLTVYLNEDHTAPVVMGAVAIKGGSKRDPKNSTGIAHYLEHMMFKGTDMMGTIDYNSEKIWLDSISLKYDELAKTQDESQRLAIQKKINEYSLKAGEYAIPNEFDRIVAQMGGTYVNAFTNEDNIVYFNLFPPNQIEKWMMLYSHRFINPVFRLFQSELETVYEEKNMSMDNFFSIMYETFLKHFFKVRPYGQQTVLGSIEHLKNPSLSEMYHYFQTYYVANNMALMISGDIKADEIIPLIEKYFGVWKNAEVPPMSEIKEEPFKGREFIELKMSPIPLGVVGFRGVKEGDADQPVLDIISQILYNNSSTGFFNKLFMDNKLMMAMVMQNTYVDDGGIVILFVPKILKQSLEDAESLVMAELERLKNGDFTDEYLESIKLNLVKYHKTRMEDMRYRPFYILSCFNTGKPWQEELEYPDKIAKITRQEVIEIAKKYFNENRLVMYSKMGKPDKEKLDKPGFEPIIPKNTEQISIFGQELERVAVKHIEPKFIKIDHDVMIQDITDKVHVYHSKNPINDIFSLTLKFGAGTTQIPLLEYGASYISLLGTSQKSFDEFNKEMQALGSSVGFTASKSYFTISLDGLDKNLESTIKLLNEFLNDIKPDPSHLSKFPREAITNRKTENKDPDAIGEALKEYALYRDKSVYLNRQTIKQVKSLNSDSLLASVRKAMTYELEIDYCGTYDIHQIVKMINDNFDHSKISVKSISPIIYDRVQHTENTIYLLEDKDLIQSQIYLIKEGNVNNDEERALADAFNEYFGNGMNSIVFQEIREFRSLAYTAYAVYQTSYYKNKQGLFYAYLSTQSDKTLDAIEAMTKLINEMPQKPDRMETVRAVLLQSINSGFPSFRSLPSTVSDFLKRGYNDDPNRFNSTYWQNMSFSQIADFFKNNLENKAVVICIAGDTKRIDKEKLAQFGKIIVVKKKKVFSK